MGKNSQELSNRPEKPRTKEELDAFTLGELVLPAALHGIVGSPDIGPQGTRLFVEQFLKSAKQDNPVLQLFIQQILVAHFRLSALQLEASKAKTLEAVKVLNDAAARLTAEYRRMILTLHHCSKPAGEKSVAFIKQQNVAQNQDVQFNQHAKSKRKKISRRTKLEPTTTFGDRFADQNQESSPRRRRQKAAAVE